MQKLMGDLSWISVLGYDGNQVVAIVGGLRKAGVIDQTMKPMQLRERVITIGKQYMQAQKVSQEEAEGQDTGDVQPAGETVLEVPSEGPRPGDSTVGDG